MKTKTWYFIPAKSGLFTLCIITLIFFSPLLWRGAGGEAFSQTPPWQWAKRVGVNIDETGYSSATDKAGNVYVCGGFSSGSITFGSNVFINNAPFFNDVFLVKYDNAGNVVWAINGSGNDDDIAYSVSVDKNGNVFIAGGFTSGTLTFGTVTINNSSGSMDIFTAKFDSNGVPLWARAAGGQTTDYGYSCAADTSGNVFITGTYYGPDITFNTTTINNSDITGSTCDFFIAKYDASGTFQWVKSFGGNSYDYGNSVCTDVSSKIYLTGGYQSSTITFGSINLTKANTNYPDVYLTKFDANGDALWVKTAVGGFAYGVASDPAGNLDVCISGGFVLSTITFGSYTLNKVGNTDAFVAKYDSTGNVLWAKRGGGQGSETANDVTIDPAGSGEVYIAGDFDSQSPGFGSFTLTNSGSTSTTDIFIAKYDNLGNELWAANPTGSANGSDYAYSVSADTSGNAFLTGGFRSTSLTFGTIVLTNAATNGTPDFYIAKIGNILTGSSELLKQNSGISIYPNPTSGKFTIQMDNVKWLMANGNTSTINHQPSTIEVYNVLGEKVYETTEDGRQMTNTQTTVISHQFSVIDLSSQPAGIYFLRIHLENNIQNVKVIKE